MSKLDTIINKLDLLCDEMNLQIMVLLKLHSNLCVCHMQQILDKPQPTVSRHLSALKKEGLITYTKNGKWRLYALGKYPEYIEQIVEQAESDLGYNREFPVSDEEITKMRHLCGEPATKVDERGFYGH